ncbi:MAG TPA: DinB family protein [Terriglobales bacterium]|nr:DinB family protein [Terriglobales bacterium]
MLPVSRRSLMRSSAIAALALCVPEVWPQGSRVLRDTQQPIGPAGAGVVTDFLDEIRLSHAYTVECAQAMAEPRYSLRPTPDMRTFGQQLVHIAESVQAIYEMFIEEKAKPAQVFSEAGQESVPSKILVVAKLHENFGYVERAALRLDGGTLEDSVPMFGGRPMTKRRVLRYLLDHATHHRGQIIVYMRLAGARPPQYRA